MGFLGLAFLEHDPGVVIIEVKIRMEERNMDLPLGKRTLLFFTALVLMLLMVVPLACSSEPETVEVI